MHSTTTVLRDGSYRADDLSLSLLDSQNEIGMNQVQRHNSANVCLMINFMLEKEMTRACDHHHLLVRHARIADAVQSASVFQILLTPAWSMLTCLFLADIMFMRAQ